MFFLDTSFEKQQLFEESPTTTMTAPPEYKSKFTFYVCFSWILAAFGGLMFGYDIGISGNENKNQIFMVYG